MLLPELLGGAFLCCHIAGWPNKMRGVRCQQLLLLCGGRGGGGVRSTTVALASAMHAQTLYFPSYLLAKFLWRANLEHICNKVFGPHIHCAKCQRAIKKTF